MLDDDTFDWAKMAVYTADANASDPSQMALHPKNESTATVPPSSSSPSSPLPLLAGGVWLGMAPSVVDAVGVRVGANVVAAGVVVAAVCRGAVDDDVVVAHSKSKGREVRVTCVSAAFMRATVAAHDEASPICRMSDVNVHSRSATSSTFASSENLRIIALRLSLVPSVRSQLALRNAPPILSSVAQPTDSSAAPVGTHGASRALSTMMWVAQSDILATPTNDVVDRLLVLSLSMQMKLLCHPVGTMLCESVGVAGTVGPTVGCIVGANEVGHVVDEPRYISDGRVVPPATHAPSVELQPHAPLQLIAHAMLLHVSIVGATVGTGSAGAIVVVVTLDATSASASGIEHM